MEGYQQVLLLERDAELALELAARQEGEALDLVDTRASHQVDLLRVFPQLAHSPCGLLIGDEVAVGHLGDAVPDRLVEGTFGAVSSSDVRHRDPGHQRRLGCSQHLEAVPQQYDDIRGKARERVRKSDHPKTDRLGNPCRRVARQQHLDPFVDAEAVRLYDAVGEAEFRRQVHPGSDHLEP